MIVNSIPNKNNPLYDYFINNKGRQIHKFPHYFDIYHNHFNRFRNTSCKIVEIGIGYGGSLQMWKNYFGIDAQIFGIDIMSVCKNLEEENIKIVIGDQENKEFLKKFGEENGPFDIVIDDGGHKMNQQITSFEILFNYVNSDGIYLIEDLHTSYWEKQYGGGYKNPKTFIEYSKNFIDLLNAYFSETEELKVNDFTKSVMGLHFYDSVLVVEKKSHIKPSALKFGTI